MRVLYATCEVSPHVKTGGLGDVSAALPPMLIDMGFDVRLIAPGVPGLLGLPGLAPAGRAATPFGACEVLRGQVPASGAPIYVVRAHEYFDRPGTPYQDPGGRDWPDNHRRFALLSWVGAHCDQWENAGWRPQVIHCHDWHFGLTPAYLRARAGAGRAVMTIHNLAFHGLFGAHVFAELALPAHYFSIAGVEFHGGVSFMKAGIVFSDRVTTVSPRYASEITKPEGGFGLDGVLREHLPVGILNGVDYSVWNPETDRLIAAHYSADRLEGKAAAKRALQLELKLTVGSSLLVGAVSRLTTQKGLDLVLEALERMIATGSQLALLGSGEPMASRFAAAAERHRGHAAFVDGFSEELAHRIIAGADVIAVPSRFEPCGLTQLYALRYGTLPLVRRVGGLADSVVDATEAAIADDSATGFVFDDASAEGFLSALDRARRCYRDDSIWRQLQRRAMAQDFSWHASAAHYIDVYRSLA